MLSQLEQAQQKWGGSHSVIDAWLAGVRNYWSYIIKLQDAHLLEMAKRYLDRSIFNRFVKS